MNVLFIYSIQKSIRQKYPLKGQEDIQFGISSISSVLKDGGHDTQLLVMDRKYNKRNNKLINKSIEEFLPSLICFSAVNTEFDFISDIALYIKKRYKKPFLLLR